MAINKKNIVSISLLNFPGVSTKSIEEKREPFAMGEKPPETPKPIKPKKGKDPNKKKKIFIA